MSTLTDFRPGQRVRVVGRSYRLLGLSEFTRILRVTGVGKHFVKVYLPIRNTEFSITPKDLEILE